MWGARSTQTATDLPDVAWAWSESLRGPEQPVRGPGWSEGGPANPSFSLVGLRAALPEPPQHLDHPGDERHGCRGSCSGDESTLRRAGQQAVQHRQHEHAHACKALGLPRHRSAFTVGSGAA